MHLLPTSQALGFIHSLLAGLRRYYIYNTYYIILEHVLMNEQGGETTAASNEVETFNFSPECVVHSEQ